MTHSPFKIALGVALVAAGLVLPEVMPSLTVDDADRQVNEMMTSQKSPYHNDHVELSNIVERAGIDVIVNDPVCDKEKVYGWYSYNHRAIVICQEGKIEGSTKQVEWTDEDYDTLRHEVHHVVQDCRDGIDGELSAIYDKPLELGLDVLGQVGVGKVARIYRDVSAHMLTMEIEAFSVAQLNNVQEQIEDVERYCM